MRKWRRELAVLGVGVLALCFGAVSVAHAQSSSTNYKVEEFFFGTGGELDASSTNYRAKQSAGELAVGNSASNNYQFYGGFNTSDIPLLEVTVNGGIFDMGILDYGITGAVSAAFSVRNYLSSGYVVVIHGDAPTDLSGGHELASMGVAGPSVTGTEGFGVNLVDNGNPDVGADPVQIPDNTFSFGTPVAGYDTSNQYKYVDGGIVALSPKSSGQTNYTLSMIANTARSTPAGDYGTSLSVQVIPTF
jgi:hypothetical protein